MRNMISVCIPTYNGENFLAQQIKSIIFQLGKNDEIIISDDGSTDKTIDIIKSFDDDRIKLYYNNNQKYNSPIYNLENALLKAQNEYIFLADQDDIWLPEKVEVMKEYLKNYDIVVSDAIIIDENDNILQESFFKINKSRKGLIKNIIKNSYIGCAMAFNKKILEKALPFPKDIPMHDWWIGLIGEIYGKTIFIEHRLIKYRRHGNNVSFTGEKSKYSVLRKIQFRLIMCKNLLLRLMRNDTNYDKN